MPLFRTRYFVEVVVTVDVETPLGELPEPDVISAVETSLHKSIDERGWTYERCQAMFRRCMVTGVRKVIG